MRKHFSDVNADSSIPTKNNYSINIPDNANNVLLINSKDRDKSRFPTQSKYSIVLNPGYSDIVSIELISARIPIPGNITANNCAISWQIGAGPVATASITPGTYETVADIIAELITAMNFIVGTPFFSGSVLGYSGKISIVGVAPFVLMFAGESVRTSNDFNVDEFGNKSYVGRFRTEFLPNSIGKLIGFEAANYASSGSIIVSPWPASLQDNSYLSLFLNRRLNFGNIDSSNSVLSKSFCVFETDLGMIRYTKMITEPIKRYTKYFPEGIPTLDVLDIEFLGPDGRQYEFNGQEHLLIFEIKTKAR
jgi:hypothetical protein